MGTNLRLTGHHPSNPLRSSPALELSEPVNPMSPAFVGLSRELAEQAFAKGTATRLEAYRDELRERPTQAARPVDPREPLTTGEDHA